ncbi:hypothetical protein GCM10027449_05580 [Sinomonas notoginsengisoli]
MAGDDAVPARREVALGEVQIGAAHAADQDPHEHLARAGHGIGPLAEHERPWMSPSGTGNVNPPSAHAAILAPEARERQAETPTACPCVVVGRPSGLDPVEMLPD